jgi:hypothetical protein
MRNRKHQEYMSLLSMTTTIIYCSVLWFGLSCLIYNMRNPELTQTEALRGVIKIIL